MDYETKAAPLEAVFDRSNGPCGRRHRRLAASDTVLAFGQRYLSTVHGGARCGGSAGGIGGAPD